MESQTRQDLIAVDLQIPAVCGMVKGWSTDIHPIFLGVIQLSDITYSTPYANHGAGIWIPTFAPFLWPSFVGKYSGTMEHMGTCNGQDKDSPIMINNDGMTIAHPMSLDHGTYLVIDFFFPIRFQKTWFLTILKKQNYSGTVFFFQYERPFTPHNASERFFTPRNAFPCKKTKSYHFRSWQFLHFCVTCYERFWTVFERFLNAFERERFFYAIRFERFFSALCFLLFIFVIFLQKTL